MLGVHVDARANLVVEFLRRRWLGSLRYRQTPADPHLLALCVQAADRYRFTPPPDACRLDPLLCDCFLSSLDRDKDAAPAQPTSVCDRFEPNLERDNDTTAPPPTHVSLPAPRQPIIGEDLIRAPVRLAALPIVIEPRNYRLVGRLVDLLI